MHQIWNPLEKPFFSFVGKTIFGSDNFKLLVLPVFSIHKNLHKYHIRPGIIIPSRWCSLSSADELGAPCHKPKCIPFVGICRNLIYSYTSLDIGYEGPLDAVPYRREVSCLMS